MPTSVILSQQLRSMLVRPGQLAARVNKSAFTISSRLMRQRLENRLATCTAEQPLASAMKSIVVTGGGSRACKLLQVDIVLTTALVGSQDTAWKRGPSGNSRKLFFESRREILPFGAILMLRIITGASRCTIGERSHTRDFLGLATVGSGRVTTISCWGFQKYFYNNQGP